MAPPITTPHGAHQAPSSSDLFHLRELGGPQASGSHDGRDVGPTGRDSLAQGRRVPGQRSMWAPPGGTP